MLKPNRAFVLSITHPAFNNASTVHVLEGEDDEGEIKTIYSVKTYPYMTHSHAKGVALRNQPRLQMYFERPLQYYLNLGFQNGFVLDGFEERSLPPGTRRPALWDGKFSEILPVLVARFRKK